ncbi:MAG TPA: hypothetical protein VNV44_11365 [Solirubrobacteraceae bacterium]|nr:hypothetical protein [Solirubrobacteraceae bacterium]
MTLLAIIFVNAVCVLVLAALVAAAIDLRKITSKSLDRARARRACRHGWDWPSFERELASYVRRRGHRPAAPPR